MGSTKTPIASVVQQAFNVAVLRGLYFIPYEPRMTAPISVRYQQWLAAGPIEPRAAGVDASEVSSKGEKHGRR